MAETQVAPVAPVAPVESAAPVSSGSSDPSYELFGVLGLIVIGGAAYYMYSYKKKRS